MTPTTRPNDGQQRLAVAYLRRSAATTNNPGNDSREAQEAAVRGLCGPAVVLYIDWGKSGSGDGTRRPEYQRLKADIAAGRVGSVCAYSLTRLGRNARELLGFVELCTAHGVTVRTASESIDTSSAMGRAMLGMMAVMAELELEQGKERTAAAMAARKARHDAAGLDTPHGVAVYGRRNVTVDGITRAEDDPERPIGPVLDAYRDAGSVRAACQLLQERGIPAPKGGDVWHPITLRRVLDVYAAEGLVDLPEVRSKVAGRRPVKASAVFAGLLRCHCGATMTPNVRHHQYYCAKGRDSGVAIHGRITVPERRLRAALEPEAERYQRQSQVAHTAIAADQAELDRIAKRRSAVEDAMIDGTLPPGKAKSAIAALDERAAELRSQAKRGLLLGQETIPEWDDVPAMNKHLRRLWSSVTLDVDGNPTVHWGIPGHLYMEPQGEDAAPEFRDGAA